MFCPAVLKHGVWEQVPMDHGREFTSVIFIQQVLSCYCLDGERKQPFKQACSTENNDAERMWPNVAKVLIIR